MKKSDILWYNSSTGETQIWFMDGHRLVGRGTVVDENGNFIPIGPPWSVVGAGAFEMEDIGGNFTFDANITAQQRTTLLERHRFAFFRIQFCNSLSTNEKNALTQTYRRGIDHGINTDPNANASAFV